jgi:signal transduction histidine kinase
LYLISLFYIPLTDREWRSLFLTRTDLVFFQRLRAAGIVESHNGGSILSTDVGKQKVVKKFLYESYSLARDSVCRNRAERLKEDRERRVRNSELDRQALEKVPEGIICVDGTGLLYYMNRPAEAMLNENNGLRTQLFGTASLEEALRGYSREKILSRITASVRRNEDRVEVFGDRIAISDGCKRFEVELGTQVILMRDTTDQYLIDQEIGKLYRHEMKAALDVMGVGLAGVKDLVNGGEIGQAGEVLDQVEEKRLELFAMLEERIDFIRLHSDAFQIRPSAVNVNLVVDKCVANYREAAAGKGVHIESNHLQTSAVIVPGEERFLMKALDNVIRNAVKFCDRGARITVTIGGEGSEAVVRIKDTGPGIAREDLGKIFQLGFTTGGTGRGLYLARRITTAHGGRIEVQSQPDQGSCFTFRLPLVMEG